MEKEDEEMKRLTTDKNVSEMSMIELAHNSCYVDKERMARYRDYELDIDARDLAKMLAKNMCNEDLTSMTDEEFDDYIREMVSEGMNSQIGIIALFYRNVWAMADLREKLEDYEDTGMTPEQVKEMQIEWVAMKAACHGWIPVTERLPEDESYILVSFENSTTPDIARYEENEEGGAFYPGDDECTYVQYGLFVNAWMPLPEPYKE